ncbi:MAG: hypothetical protein WC975_07305 [Phycisphaerae bacterium]
MPNYQLQIASSTVTLKDGPNDRVSLLRLGRSYNGSTNLELILHDTNLIGRAGLRSGIKFWSDGQLIFSGKIMTQETFAGSSGSGKRITAAGPLDWCEFIRITDMAGVPRLQFTQTTVGNILQEIFSRHGQTMRDLEIADGNFYTADLGELVDHLWIENHDLKTILLQLLSLGNYSLGIDPETLAWQILPPEQLNVYEMNLRRGSPYGLVGYRIHSSLADCCSAVRLVSDRQTAIAFAEAVPAWDSELESQWQLRHARYASPDSDQPDNLVWVFRRFSYGGIENLLENQPVELVQKVPTESGGWTYELIETLAPDRVNKYITAKFPVLASPEGRRINIRNPLPAGKSQMSQVFIRYRYLLPQAAMSVRYPSSGYGGQVLETAGLASELVMYLSDSRQLSESRARRIWHQKAQLNPQIELTLTGPLVTEIFSGPRRLRLLLSDNIDLPRAESFLPDLAEYDFAAGTIKINLRRSGFSF